MPTRTALAILTAVAGLAHAQEVPALSYIGQQIIPTGATFGGTTVGGLSGIDYDASSNSFYAISDDRSQLNPARFYNLSLGLSSTSFSSVTFNSVTSMLRPDGTPFPTFGVDPESIRRNAATGRFFWSSEGERNGADLQNPFVREMNADGSFVRQLNTPARYNPSSDTSGIRRNLAFESLTMSTDGTRAFTATENALIQDGPAADLSQGSPCRVLSFDLASGNSGAEYVYVTDPVARVPNPVGSFATNGLVEMLAIGDNSFLALERSFSTGVGNTIKIYKTSFSGATDVSAFDALPGAYTAMSKELLFDLDSLGILLDNIEGITLGPTLENGNLSLILVADNNFAASQFTQFIAFEVVPAPAGFATLTVGLLAASRRRRTR